MGMNLDSGELIAVKQVNFVTFFFDCVHLRKLLIFLLLVVFFRF